MDHRANWKKKKKKKGKEKKPYKYLKKTGMNSSITWRGGKSRSNIEGYFKFKYMKIKISYLAKNIIVKF